MENILLWLIHHGDSFLENEPTVYKGGTVTEFKIDVDEWSYFELVGIMNELGYREIDMVWYNDPTSGKNFLSDDKGALDIIDICKEHLGVDIYI